MIALLMEIIPTCLELRVSYDWWIMASKWSQNGLPYSNFVGVARIVRLHPDYLMCVLQTMTSLLATNCV